MWKRFRYWRHSEITVIDVVTFFLAPEITWGYIGFYLATLIRAWIISYPWWINLLVVVPFVLLGRQTHLRLVTHEWYWHPRHWVRIPGAYDLAFHDRENAREWCRTSCSGAWAVGQYRVYLNSETDAALFKLFEP